MTIDLNHITLTVGSHRTRSDGVCLTEAVAWWAGEEHTDAPACVSPVLVDYGRALNDSLPDHLRQQLVPLIPTMVGTAGDGLDAVRSHLALDWIVRIYTPPWLELAGLADSAASLRGLEPITDPATALAAAPVVREARKRASAARFAVGAVGTAWDAWAAVKAAARAVAGDAAWAAGTAAWDAAATAAEAATGAVAEITLASTVADLQTSALDLLKRMVRP